MELVAMLKVLRRWWWLMVLVPAVSAAALWWGLRSRPPAYQARVTVQITTPQREDVAVGEEYRYGSLRDEITVARNNFTELLQSDDVRHQTARQLGLSDEEMDFPVQVSTVGDADFVNVTVEAGSQVMAARIANTLVDATIAYYGDLRARPTYAERDLFAEKLRAAEKDFRAAQQHLAEFQADNAVASLEEQLKTNQNLLEQLQLERDRLLVDETTRVSDPIPQVDRLIAQHQKEVDRLAALITASTTRTQLPLADTALASFAPQPDVTSLENELAIYQKLLEELRLERDRMLLEETTRNVDAVSEVDKLITQRQREMDRLSALVPIYDLLEQDLAQAREQHSYILNKYTEAELKAAAVSAANFIQIVEAAQPPTEPASQASMLLVLAIAGSVGVAILLAFLLEAISSAVDDRISPDEDDRQSIMGLPILGVVPRMADGRCRPDSPEAEAVRQLRTRLLMASPGGQWKTLLVTSPQPEDGKSVVATNLATTLAASGANVVLVDADLRAPGLLEWFGRPTRTGLTDWLKAGETSLERLLPEVVCNTHVPGLSIVAAGPLPQDPSFLLASPNMAAVMKILSERFDSVVLDGPPVVIAPDAVVLARLAQSTLLVLSPDRTSRRIARQAVALLTSWDDIHIVGVALNRTSLRSYGHYHYGHQQAVAQKAAPSTTTVLLQPRGQEAGLISTAQAAAIYGVRPATVKRWCREGQLPALRRGLKWWVIQDPSARP